MGPDTILNDCHRRALTETIEAGPIPAVHGVVRWRIKASGHLEMCWHLYSWGKSVEVLQAAALREMVHSHRRDFDALP